MEHTQKTEYTQETPQLRAMAESLGETTPSGFLKGIGAPLVCPVCQDAHVHVRTEGSGFPSKDYMVAVFCWCEQGHAFDLCFHFHEGETTAFVQVHREPVPMHQNDGSENLLFDSEDLLFESPDPEHEDLLFERG